MSTAEHLIPDTLDDEPAPTDPVELDGWFDAMLQQLADIRDEVQRNEAVAEARIQRVRDWLEQENAVLERRAEHIRRRIQEHAMAYDFGSKKSRSLPSGRFGFRKAPATLRVVDAEKLLAACRELGIPTRVTERPDANAVKEYIRSTGLNPDGCELVEGDETFFAEPVK